MLSLNFLEEKSSKIVKFNHLNNFKVFILKIKRIIKKLKCLNRIFFRKLIMYEHACDVTINNHFSNNEK